MSIQYPLEKEKAGNHSWSINHHLASLYPLDNPTDKQKQRMKTTILTNMTAVSTLCKNCKMDIKKYLRENPLEPALVGRSALSLYLCNFHNYVNKKTGKPLQVENCQAILRDIPMCKDCQVEIKKVEAADKIQENKDELTLKQSFEAYKDASRHIVKALCKKYDIPVPFIKFHHCPSNPETSCTEMLVDNNTNEIVERPTIYLHPNIAGLRTIPHEVFHLVKQFKGDVIGGLSEYEVEKEAQKLIDMEFPYDAIVATPRKKVPITVRHDDISTLSTVPSHLKEFPNAARIYSKYLHSSKRHDYGNKGEGGDLVFDWIDDITGKKKQQQEPSGPEQEVVDAVNELGRLEQQASHSNQNDMSSALSGLDELYQPFANILGVKASDLNRGQTPAILGNAVISLLESNLTPLGSMLVSLLTSTSIFSALALGKHGITYGDRLLMNGMGSQFMWHTFGYMNPKIRGDIIADAMELGQVISAQKWDMIPDYLVDSPFMSMFSGQASAGDLSTASPQTARRQSQRASGSGGRSISRGSTTTSGSANRRQQQLEERTMQKLTGKVTAPMNPQNVRDVRGGGIPDTIMKKDRNTINLFGDDYPDEDGYDSQVDDNTVIIPSSDTDDGYEDEKMYEVQSSFGMSVANGRRNYDDSNSMAYYDDSYILQQQQNNANYTYIGEDIY